MPLQVGGDKTAGLAAGRFRDIRDPVPATVPQGEQLIEYGRSRGGGTGRPAVHTDRTAGADMERAMRAGGGAAGAFVDGGSPAGVVHGTQQEGVEDEFVWAVPGRDRTQGTRGERVQPR